MNDHSRSRDGISYPGICVRIWKMAKLWIIVATVLGVVTEAYGNGKLTWMWFGSLNPFSGFRCRNSASSAQIGG